MGYSSQLGFEFGIGYSLRKGVAQNLRKLRGRHNRPEFGLVRGTLSVPIFRVANGRHLLDDLVEHDIDIL